MPESRETLARKLTEKQSELHELIAVAGRFDGYAEVGGDFSKRKEALEREISNIKSELAELDGDAHRT